MSSENSGWLAMKWKSRAFENWLHELRSDVRNLN